MSLPFAVDADAVKAIPVAVVVVLLIGLKIVYAGAVGGTAAAGRCVVDTAGPIDMVTAVDTDDDSDCTVIVLLT